ncbi:MAG: SDR family oxidoreductase [Defluviitaleaceae bacterium]|nr:SDR family oxidoreductase [Defluviitaleaceae bacterium]
MKRTVLVTGSSRGIGLAIAREFAALGDRVVLNGRVDQVQLDTAVKALSNLNNAEIMGILADISDYSQAQEAFAKIKTKFGPVDVLINNAGMAHFGLFSDMTPSQWSEVMHHNFTTVLNATHLAVPDMVSKKSGVIINISSMWGTTGASCESVYAAAKGAVHAFTKSMAKELGPSGVRANAIACGAIETRMNARLSQEEKLEFTENISLMRFGTPAEVGKLVRFLASDDAAYLTGQIIGMDGGMV